MTDLWSALCCREMKLRDDPLALSELAVRLGEGNIILADCCYSGQDGDALAHSGRAGFSLQYIYNLCLQGAACVGLRTLKPSLQHLSNLDQS